MSDTLSLEAYKSQLPKKTGKRSKMGNVPKEYGGRTYQSTKEANKAKDLDWQKQLGRIKDWTPQVPYQLWVDGQLITTYVLDFLVEHIDGSFSYLDVKGAKKGHAYEMFKIKKRLMAVCHAIKVEEI